MADLQSFEFDKHPDAEFSFAIDYSNDLDAGEQISSVVTTAIDLSNGDDVKSTILSGAAQIQNGVDVDGNSVTNAKVAQKVVNGTIGKSYKITIESTTSKPDVFPAEIKMDVKYGVQEP